MPNPGGVQTSSTPRANAEAALANMAAIPEAAAAFSLTRDATAEFADLVDER